MSSIDTYTAKLVGKKIKALRASAGYTAPQFARLIGKSEQQLYRYERGINKIEIGTLLLYLKTLNANIPRFFSDVMDDINENKISI